MYETTRTTSCFSRLNDRYCKHNLVTNKAGEVVKIGLELMIKELSMMMGRGNRMIIDLLNDIKEIRNDMVTNYISTIN